MKPDPSGFIDHTLLRQDASAEEIEKLCLEALNFRFYSVCVNPCHVENCLSLLRDTPVKICTVAGFPLGAMHSAAKAYEASLAVSEGADEIDMVINIGALKEGDLLKAGNDISEVRSACAEGIVLKVIIETCLLTEEEKKAACRLALDAGADFVKTSTGFSGGGASEEDVRLMKEAASGRLRVKASGGIKTLDDALKMISAGADRLGTSSGAAIMKQFKAGFQQ